MSKKILRDYVEVGGVLNHQFIHKEDPRVGGKLNYTYKVKECLMNGNFSLEVLSIDSSLDKHSIGYIFGISLGKVIERPYSELLSDVDLESSKLEEMSPLEKIMFFVGEDR